MVKNIVIGALALILIGAVAVGVYQWWRLGPTTAQAAAAGSQLGQGGQGQGWRGGQGTAAASPTTQTAPAGEPQSVPSSAWTTVAGVVQAVEVSGLSVTTADGQALWIQLGPNHFWSGGFTVAVGETVTVTGFTENGQFMAARIVNDASGQAFTLRADSGQPLWTGGQGNH